MLLGRALIPRAWLLLGGVALLLSAGLVRAAETDAAARAAAERAAVGVCANCHGWRGHSIQPKFPVLAAQHADYLLAQLRAFKAQTRGDPDALAYMWGMASPLDDATMSALADYYSRQKPWAGERGDPRLIARGQQIYQHGDATEGIPPCAACHGPEAAGTDLYPRLAGQHVQYLMKQLRSFQNNLRDVAIMHGVAQGLKVADMHAVSEYLQALGP
ncbi:MAG TPA: c-type cytochrome [Steroidobacteraceae bacterium]|nr:c-type cytochrome [Steroidobacteraceae bacterium]